MTKHFHKELEKIKKLILSLGAMVEERVQMATAAINKKDMHLVETIIKNDYEIDEMEVEVEEECLKILALYQPVAVDLRFLIAVIKINNDLERIGDMAVNIAQRIMVLSKQDKQNTVFDYSVMAEKAQSMLKMSLDALVNLDADLAFKVLLMDDEVDKMRDEAYDRIKLAMINQPAHLGYFINLLLISRHLERLADHTTNIVEEVIYMIEGEVIRHENIE